LSRGQLRQMGHQDFGVLRAHVTPSFTQDHGDVTDMTQTQAFAISNCPNLNLHLYHVKPSVSSEFGRARRKMYKNDCGQVLKSKRCCGLGPPSLWQSRPAYRGCEANG
jgi:hypothetical protein